MENRPAPLRSRRVCRFCLTENEPLSFIYDRELSRPFQVPLSLQIMSCVAIEVYSSDGMPQMICHPCRSNLDRCYRFKQQCKKADEALRAYPVTGTLPRPFPPIKDDLAIETGAKRTLESRAVNDQSKKPRLDNGERERREVAGQQQETRAEKREREEHHDIYDEEQDEEGEHDHNTKEDTKLEPGEIRVHACNQCDRTFPLLQSLQLHTQRAHRDRDFKCTECDRMFFSKYDLNKHMTTHSEEKPFSCQICQKQFSRANLLQRHEKTHREELRYGCEHCDREFFTTEELEKHEEAVHKAVKPYQCNICSKRFTYKQGLERHEMLHNEDKSFVCEYCKEAFRTSTKLARHLQTHAGHRPYLCKLCPRSFLLSHHLTRHMRSHSVEKRHQCEECGKAFKRKESLEVHLLTHVKRPGMGLTCDICQESCRNRADYVTHIKQHIEAGEKMGPDGLPAEKDKFRETESEEDEEDEEEEEEDQYSDDDYQPPSSYAYSTRKVGRPPKKVDSEDEHLEKEEKKEQIVYVRGKDGNLVKKTIKTLMPVTRQSQEAQKAKTVSSQQVVNSKREELQPPPQSTQKIPRVDETEAQVQKIVASVFKEHKIPLKHQEGKESSQTITRQASGVAPTIIKEEKVDPPLTSITSKSPGPVKVIKRFIVRKPAGSGDPTQAPLSTPVKELIQEATTSQQATVAATPSTSAGPKVTKRVIVRRIIRQGDTTREVIMNPDGTIIDPAELAKLPTGNVVKRVVVKKPIDKSQNIEAMLQATDAKSILQMAEAASNVVVTPKTVRRVEAKQVPSKDDRETQQKLKQLQKCVEQQRLKIEELQARKQQEYDPDDMLPERHDESEDEQQLPLKRVFVKRKQCIYDEVREYNDDPSVRIKEIDENPQIITASSLLEADNEEMSTDKIDNPAKSIEDAKIIIIKPEESQPDVDEMSQELCNILESTDSVVKMQETVLNNLTEITSVDGSTTRKIYETITEETAEEVQAENVEAQTMVEQMETEEATGEIHHEQVEEETTDIQEDVSHVNQPDQSEVKLQFETSTEEPQQLEEVVGETTEGQESGLSAVSAQVLPESNDIFETTDTAMEVDGNKIQEQQNLNDSVVEITGANQTINLNETTDQSSRDSLEDKLSQMEG